MALMRALGRAGTLAMAGAAAGVYLRRKGLLGGGSPALVSPAPVPVTPEPEAVVPAKEAEPETLYGVVEEPDPATDEPEAVEAEPEDAELVAGEADPTFEPTFEPTFVPTFVPTIEPEEETVDATAVEEPLEPGADDVTEPLPAAEERPDVIDVVDDLLAAGRPREGAMVDAWVVEESEDAQVAEAVRTALAEEPGLLSAPVDIEVESGRVTLLGELGRAEIIAAVGRKAEAVEGVRSVQNLLHLAGTPVPRRP